MDDIASLKVEVATALANNEILASNVETLRALSLQLAVQVEELTLQLQSSTTESESVVLRLRRDADEELQKVKNYFLGRIAELNDALVAEGAALRDTVALWEDREVAAERRLAALEREKDRTISSLMHEIEVLRQSSAYRSGGVVVTPKPAHGQGSSIIAQPLGRRSDSEPLTNILSIAIALSSEELARVRYAPDEHKPLMASTTKRASFHADIVADPLLLELVKSSDVPLRDQRWRFRLCTGEEFTISIDTT